MNLPFTTEQFLAVFRDYNQAVWPMQLVLNGLAIIVLAAALFSQGRSDRFIAGSLAFFWLWTGVVYHLLYFSRINKAAYVFGALNIAQGALFLWYGVLRHRLVFRPRRTFEGVMGWLIILYALLIYPFLGEALGHGYPQSPTFGLPCPTTIFTFGVLLWTAGEIALPILAIPSIWAVIGFTAAVTMGIHEDSGLLLSGAITAGLLQIRRRRLRHHETSAVVER